MCAIYIRKAAPWIFPDNQNKWPDSDTEWIGLDRGYSVFVVLNISKVVNWIELDWLQQCLSSGKVFYSANLPLQLFGPLWIPAFSVKLIDLMHWTEECVCVWLYVALNLYMFLHICIYYVLVIIFVSFHCIFLLMDAVCDGRWAEMARSILVLRHFANKEQLCSMLINICF